MIRKNDKKAVVEDSLPVDSQNLVKEDTQVQNSTPTTTPQAPVREPVETRYSSDRAQIRNNNQRSVYSPSMSRESMDNQATIAVEGYLQVMQDYGILRQSQTHAPQNSDTPQDVYVSPSQIKKLGMRKGDLIKGYARSAKEGERYLSLLKVDTIGGLTPDKAFKRPFFASLTPIFPDKKITLETSQESLGTRLIDLVAPIGRGQRGLIVAPPKAGKTWLLTEIAHGITTNDPELKLLVVLIGERPEEVTHIAREVKGEVISSNFDEDAVRQTTVAELGLERAKRMAETGQHVVILLDSITRLARAYNLVVPPSGRTLSGGLDPVSLYPPKHFFGAARNFEEGGSLTILGTALVDTGSKMDDVIYEEFKGTGNMELHLDRNLSERRIYPAIDIKRSGTRHEERLFNKDELEKVFTFRRMLDLLSDDEATSLVIDKLKKTKNNKEFMSSLGGGK